MYYSDNNINFRKYLSRYALLALKKLSTDKNVEITRLDKSNGLVLLVKDDYII